MALNRWQQQLYDLLAAVQIKQHQYDLASTACQVLLKPWPKKSQESGSSAKKDVPNSNGEAANPHISPREEAELKVVNDLLKKAQKTRVKTTITKLKEHVCPVDGDLLSSKGGKELWEICDSDSQTVQDPTFAGDTLSSDLIPESVIKTNDSSKKDAGNAQSEWSAKNVIKKQQQRIHPATQSGKRTSQVVNKNHLGATGVTKPVPTTDQKRPRSRESTGGSRPPSRPRSAHGTCKPAHTTAPFKTDSSLHAPKRFAKNSVRQVKQQPAGKRQNYAGDRNYLNKVLPPIGSENAPSPSLVCDVQKDNGSSDVCDVRSSHRNGELAPKIEYHGDPQTKTEGQKKSCHGEVLNSKLSTLTLESVAAQDGPSQPLDVGVKAAHPEGGSSQLGEKQEAKVFSLLSDGSSINIPPRVRRAFAKNQHLRKKVVQQDTGKKPKSNDNLGQKFADSLQQLFDPEEELLCRQKALECLRTHQQLLQLLAHLDLDLIAETSSAKDILRAKMLSEFVLSAFSELSEEVNFLSKVQFGDTPAVVQLSHRKVGDLYQWLPTCLQEEEWHLAHRLHYTSRTDLNQYMSALLRLQTLKFQRHLLDILVSDILPWLQQQDCSQE